VEDPWLLPYQFDYIHGRALALCFRSQQTVFQNAFDALRLGGIFEIQDVALPMVCIDDMSKGTAVDLWVYRLIEGGKALGKVCNSHISSLIHENYLQHRFGHS
jgi:hypothetical protein